MSSPAAVLAVHQLGLRGAGGWRVEEVCLSLAPGEVVGLLGANGAGKTTIFSLLAGLRRADTGEVRLAGVELGTRPLWQRARLGLGYLPQEPALFMGMGCLDNLLALAELMPALGHLTGSERRRRALASLERFDLAPLAARPARALSGGERRRLALARTLLAEPRVLLLDEPLAGIDPIAVGEVRAAIASLSASGVAVLMTDHNVEATLAACHRAYLLVAGRVAASGTPHELVADAAARAHYFGADYRLGP